jgi:hypothetical protein
MMGLAWEPIFLGLKDEPQMTNVYEYDPCWFHIISAKFDWTLGMVRVNKPTT